MTRERQLEQFGFDAKRAKVYLALLELGEGKVFEIAKKAGVERPTAYDVLGKLCADGFASFYEKRRVRYYIAEDPEHIARKLEQQQRAFARVLPELKSIQNTLTAKPTIRFYDGIAGIKTIFEDTLTARTRQLRGILSVVDLFKIPGKAFVDDYVARRINAGVRLRVIRSKPKEVPEYWPTDLKALRELRYAPAEMVFAMTMYVYDKKVGLISSQKENFGMLIESEEFATNIGHLFDALWQISMPA